MYKDLYLKIQHLEKYPEVLPQARQKLCSLLSKAYSRHEEQSIMTISSYSRPAMEQLLINEHELVLSRWEQYLATTQQSSSKSSFHFASRQEAKEWLRRISPAKYVDGAWLGHIHKIATPFALRGITKDAWQVLSEELGDGDLRKNHVYLYRQLLRDNDILLPEGDSPHFVHPDYSHGMDDVKTWRSAVSQLLISLFPEDFMPEILGFNLHFEQLTLETLIASRELPRFGISEYYFQLHISIDNADSGHAAMALSIVARYMDHITELEGEAAAQVSWRRIQAGYMLSRSAGDGVCESTEALKELSLDHETSLPTEDEAAMIAMLKLKARVSHKIHCPSRVKVGHRTIAEWLSSELWSSDRPQDQMCLLNDLAGASPWVRRGDSAKSRLIRELSLDGRMFGAFTHAEVDRMKHWIDSLGTSSVEMDEESMYWRLVGHQQQLKYVPIPKHLHVETDLSLYLSHTDADVQVTFPRAPIAGLTIVPAIFMPLWFSHCCLLENTVAVPFRSITSLSSHILRILRAESGFTPETEGVAGMDEQHQTSHPSLVDLGLEIWEKYAASSTSTTQMPTCLEDVLTNIQVEGDEEILAEARGFSKAMLLWSERPVANLGLLLGLCRAFLDLESRVAGLQELLSEKSRCALGDLVSRKSMALDLCVEELKRNDDQHRAFLRGYDLGRNWAERAIV